MNSKRVSPSTIDCICCSLGAIALLWLSTLASALGSVGDVDSMVVARITLTYAPNNVEAIQQHAKTLAESWYLEDRPLADCYSDRTIVPRLETWPLQSLKDGTEGRCSFGPQGEEAYESVRLVSITPRVVDPTQIASSYTWTRVITVQRRRKEESVAVGIEFQGDPLTSAEVSITMNGKSLKNKNEATFNPNTKRLQIVADGVTATIRTLGDP